MTRTVCGLACSGNYAIVHSSSANGLKDARLAFIIAIKTLNMFRATVQISIIVLSPVVQLLLSCLRTFKVTVLLTYF